MRVSGTVVRGLLAMVVAAGCAIPFRAEGPKRAVMNPLAESERAVMQGRVDEAIGKLHVILTANPADAQAHLLLCRAYYSEELGDPAVTECEAALSTLGGDSTAQDWMGRAYGLKADRSGPIQGYKLATKVKLAFEAAVQLDPKNGAAVNDLSEYYVSAPSILGGGVDKATALADRSQAALPQETHRIRAMVAEKERDFGTAEREFKAAVGVGGHPDAWTDLGHFYFRRADMDHALEALHHAVEADRAHDAALVDVASILIKMKREPETAEHALMDYLASNAKSDDSPAFKAYLELGNLKQSRGDKAGAEAAYQQALALAKDFAPAKRAVLRGQ